MDDDRRPSVPADTARRPALRARHLDTRGNLACTLLAAQAIRAAGVKLRGTLKCVYTADEEKHGPDGAIYLLDERGLTADYTIVCEPTGWTAPDGHWGMGVAVANSGNCLLELETSAPRRICGGPTPASTPSARWRGSSARWRR